jgi:hypothetical protein
MMVMKPALFADVERGSSTRCLRDSGTAKPSGTQSRVLDRWLVFIVGSLTRIAKHIGAPSEEAETHEP